MGIGTGILNMLGRRLDNSARGQLESLARTIFARVPIDAVKEMYDLFGRGGIIESLMMQGLSRREAEGAEYEAEYRVNEMFKAAREDGPGSQSDQSARTMAINIAAAFAKRGPIEVVMGLSEAFYEIVKQNRVIDGNELRDVYEAGVQKALRSPYVREKQARSA